MLKAVKIFVGAMLAIATAIPAPALAFGPGSFARNLGGNAKLEFISTTHRIVGPFAQVLFCKSNPQECKLRRSRWSRLEATLDEKSFAELQTVNRQVNRQIRPQNDNPAIGGGDVWSLAPQSGDCEDYAITKRHDLIAKGWPPHTLRLAIAYTAFGEGHLVLVVKTNGGDLVLDNRINAIRRWNKTGLRWVMIQSAANPMKWMAI